MDINRQNKGKNILIGKRHPSFPDSYVAIDVETTGKFDDDEIIEIAAVKVFDNIVVDTFQSLVKPIEPIPEDISEITGITNDMLSDADDISSVIPIFADFTGDSIILGHNVNFDIRFIYDAYTEILKLPFSNDYIDTLHISRRMIPDLPHHRLIDISEYFNIVFDDFHRALNDCYYTHACYQKLKYLYSLPEYANTFKNTNKARTYNSSTDKASLIKEESDKIIELRGILKGLLIDDIITESEIINLDLWLNKNNNLSENAFYKDILCSVKSVLADGIIDEEEKEYLKNFFESTLSESDNAEKNPLTPQGNTFCLSGNFDIYSKSQMSILISNAGGVVVKNVTKQLNYLVVGNNCSSAWKHGNYGTKIEKAKEYIKKGINIKIISENDIIAAIK